MSRQAFHSSCQHLRPFTYQSSSRKCQSPPICHLRSPGPPICRPHHPSQSICRPHHRCMKRCSQRPATCHLPQWRQPTRYPFPHMPHHSNRTTSTCHHRKSWCHIATMDTTMIRQPRPSSIKQYLSHYLSHVCQLILLHIYIYTCNCITRLLFVNWPAIYLEHHQINTYMENYFENV